VSGPDPGSDSGGGDPGDIDLGPALAALARGEIVAFPTESSYGLAVDALDPAALERLWALKQRPADKVVALIVADRAMAGTLCRHIPGAAERLMAAHWPGPLTLALPARPGLPPGLVSEGCVAMRCSSHPVARALAAGLGRPITATSANRAGGAPAHTADEVRATFPTGCLVLDAGPAAGGAPSTLARIGEAGRIQVLRRGPVVL
jgi:L-threonylcarbamoyladenylate synthase